MLDDYKQEQEIVYKTLTNAIKNNKYSHAYLFETHGYSNTLPLIIAFVKSILCPKNYSNNQYCVDCTQCKIIDDNNYIELKIIRPDGQWIKKEQLSELQQEFSKKAISGSKKIYIITEADKLNASSSNSILKFLEEPEENIIAILMVENKYQLLDTIVSRCQVISLINNQLQNQNVTTIDKIYNTIGNNNIDEEKIEKAINFVDYYEKNGLDTLLNTQKLWHQYFSDKDIIIDALEIMTLYYMDVINYTYNYPLNIFNDYIKNIDYIKNKNSIDNLVNKINVILNIKDLIKYNVNNNLIMDKLILEMEERKND